MILAGKILGWIFGILLIVLMTSMFLTGNTLRAVLLLGAVLLLLPPVHTLLQNQTGVEAPALVRILGVIVLVGAFGWSMSNDEKTSIYFTPEIEEQMMAIYEEKLDSWPVPYEARYVETSYGKMHVIICGPEDAPPMMLYNAGQMAGWSWITNVEAWSQQYRIYAVDTIGEPGRSRLNDINTFPSNGPAQADLQIEVLDALGLDKVNIVGASNGGFIGAHVAIAYPERVDKLALLGPMGLTPSTNENIMRIIFAQMLPLKMVQDSTIHWSFGDDPDLLEQIETWFRLVLTGTAPQQSPPVTMTPQELQGVGVPTLLVLGTNDSLMGNLGAVRELASNVPDLKVVEIEAGHLMGVENPGELNRLVLEFIE